MRRTLGTFTVACIASMLKIHQYNCNAFVSHYPKYYSARIIPVNSFPKHDFIIPRKPTGIFMGKKDDDDDSSHVEKKALKDLSRKFTNTWRSMLTKLINLFPTLRVAFTSFAVGAIMALVIVFVPVYTSVDKMSEQVTLFETILTDLDRGYVDPVDQKKLFEIGVSAMLKSLDPYTEFEGKEDAQELNESVQGRYAGIGLVISGPTKPINEPSLQRNASEEKKGKTLPNDAVDNKARLLDDDNVALDDGDFDIFDDDLDGSELVKRRSEEKKAAERARERGIRVVNAFEGYAFDYGMRTGDKLVAIDGWKIPTDVPVEQVRNRLRGEPNTSVDITFERAGVEGLNTLTIPRKIVQISDVKLATLVGKPKDGIGYIQLTGFTSNCGRDVRNAIFSLQAAAEEASGGEQSLQGLILDMRGNPGGLLTSAVDVASLLVPKGSEIVSARGRGFPGVTYKSRVDPILDPRTKLAVLINESTASAAEIVSGAVQDLDVGVIVGSGRSFGKGLVQNVEDLPFNTALKFTVAKYYTPSGRCIQSTNYQAGDSSDLKYKASKVSEKDRTTFFTKNGREVKDGGGVMADYKISAPKASALEVTLLRSGIISDFASEWSKHNQFSSNFEVNDAIYREFQNFVLQKQQQGEIKLDALYAGPLEALKQSLKLSEYKTSEKEFKQLELSIRNDMLKDFEKYRKDIKEDIANGILSRYLPDSMIIERSIKSDVQVLGAIKLLLNQSEFNKLLAKGDITPNSVYTAASNFSNDGAKLNLKF